MNSNIESSNATGRRREAVARVRLTSGTGNIFVNRRPCDEYFIRETDRIVIRQPFQATNTQNKFDCFEQSNLF